MALRILVPVPGFLLKGQDMCSGHVYLSVSCNLTCLQSMPAEGVSYLEFQACPEGCFLFTSLKYFSSHVSKAWYLSCICLLCMVSALSLQHGFCAVSKTLFCASLLSTVSAHVS